MKALILAAGFGTRLRPYTEHIPKPLFEINNRPILDITISQLIKAGCSSIIINTHHLHRQLESFIKKQNYSIPVETRHELEILDTGGAIRNVSDFLGAEPFFVVNSDIVTSIDYKAVYKYHLSHNYPATLVLHDCLEFNKVSVDQKNMIKGFHLENCQLEKLAFTGIQVINPEVLSKIPEKKFTSSIALYKKLIQDNSGVSAYIAKNSYWADIGSPEKYSAACIEKAIPRVFKTGKQIKTEITKLKGDGSDRKWYRLVNSEESVILGDHGISCNRQITSEVESFISIGNHLYNKNVPVPKIIYSSVFPGHVFLQDLGDIDLEQIINKDKSEDNILFHYRKVLKSLVEFSVHGGSEFNSSWTYQTEQYDKDLIINNECNYFITAFLNKFTKNNYNPDELLTEFTFIADKALEFQIEGLMHRDCQSKNIMVLNNNHYFIDFQGGRLGPVQYDLASLLLDPYVELSTELQAALYNYFIDELSKEIEFNKENFYESYKYLKITRNLQMLGAFGFLSRVKGKTYFEDYIPAAVKTLKRNIKDTATNHLPQLKQIIDDL